MGTKPVDPRGPPLVICWLPEAVLRLGSDAIAAAQRQQTLVGLYLGREPDVAVPHDSLGDRHRHLARGHGW